MNPIPQFDSGHLSLNSIKLIAESLGIPNLDDSLSNILSENITYLLIQLIQNAQKFSRHQKRTFLSVQDFSKALVNHNFEPFYGFSQNENTPYKNCSVNNKEIYIADDSIPEMDLGSVALSNLPKLTVNPYLKAHWLLIEGNQPLIPENINPEHQNMVSSKFLNDHDRCKREKLDDKSLISKKKHVTKKKKVNLCLSEKELNQILPISMEQQLYFKDISEACVGSEETRRSQAFQSLATDPGLHSLLPRFAMFISRGVKINLLQRNLAVLIYLMRMVRALLENPHLLNCTSTTDTEAGIKMESRSKITSTVALFNPSSTPFKKTEDFSMNKCDVPIMQLRRYAHALVPAVMSCCFCDTMCQRPEIDNHWALRDFSAKLLASFCKHLDNSTNALQNRVCRLSTHLVAKYLTAATSPSSNKTPILSSKTITNSAIAIPSVVDDLDTNDLLNVDDSKFESYFADSSSITNAPSFSSLYGAITCLFELGPFVLNVYLPPPKLKELDALLTTQRSQLERQNAGLPSTLLHGAKTTPLSQQQKHIADRVSIEHVKQLLVKIGALLYRFNLSSNNAQSITDSSNPTKNLLADKTANTTHQINLNAFTVNLEELKDKFGPSLATSIYAHIKKLLLQQQQQQLQQQQLLQQQKMDLHNRMSVNLSQGVITATSNPLSQTHHYPQQLHHPQIIRQPNSSYTLMNSSNPNSAPQILKQEFRAGNINNLFSNTGGTAIRINQFSRMQSPAGANQTLLNASQYLAANNQSNFSSPQPGYSQPSSVILNNPQTAQINNHPNNYHHHNNFTTLQQTTLNHLGNSALSQSPRYSHQHLLLNNNQLSSSTSSITNFSNNNNNNLTLNMKGGNASNISNLYQKQLLLQQQQYQINSAPNSGLVLNRPTNTPTPPPHQTTNINNKLKSFHHQINNSGVNNNNNNDHFINHNSPSSQSTNLQSLNRRSSSHSDYIKQFINENSTNNNNAQQAATKQVDPIEGVYLQQPPQHTPNYIKFKDNYDESCGSNDNNNNNIENDSTTLLNNSHDSDIECVMEIEPSSINNINHHHRLMTPNNNNSNTNNTPPPPPTHQQSSAKMHIVH